MDILRKIAREDVILNKKRTIYTCIGIILSTALLAVFFILSLSAYESALDSIKDEKYYHFVLGGSSTINGVKMDEQKIEKLEKNKQVKKIDTIYHLQRLIENLYGYKIASADEQTLRDLNITLLEGRYPKSDTEIIVPKYILVENDNLQIGDKLKVKSLASLYKDDDYQQELAKMIDKTYTVVGVTDEEHVYTYFLFTSGIKTKYPLYLITLNNPQEYKKVIPQILGLKNMQEVYENEIDINKRLLNLENYNFSNNTYFIIILTLLIIIVSSILYIKNSFSILVSEKSRLYGMLLSVGATRKQIKKVVLREGFIIGLFSIPLGLLIGIPGSWMFAKISDRVYLSVYSRLNGSVNINLYALLLAAIISAIIIYVSIVMILHKSFQVSPLDNIRRSKYIKRGDKKEVPKYIKAIFKTGGVIAYNDIKHSRKKYRTTAIAIVLSVALFIVSNTLINYKYSNYSLTDIANTNYVALSQDARVFNDKTIQRIRELDSVKKINVFYVFSELDFKAKGIPTYYEFELCEDEVFRECVSELHLDYEEVKDKAIIFDKKDIYNDKDEVIATTHDTNFTAGDTLDITFKKSGKRKKIAVAATTFKNVGNFDSVILANSKYFKDIKKENVYLRIKCTSTNEFKQDLINNRMYFKGGEWSIDMADVFLKEEVFSRLFLYGFVLIISLIGIINLFNTVAANVNFRSREIAMYKSVGVSTKEFKHMIMYETLSYTIKALVIGIVLGVAMSYGLYQYLVMRMRSSIYYFIFPLKAIILSIVVVLAMVYIVMRYTVSKIDKKNIIETIRQENI